MFLSSLVVWLLTLNLSAMKVSCSCTVFPVATAVVAGDSLSLTCVPDSRWYVSSLTRDDGANGTVRIYNSTMYDNVGQITRNRSVADGYSADDESARPNVTFTINKSVTTQAGSYNCLCVNSVDASNYFASVNISVLVSEPQVSSTGNGSCSSINDVQLNCSVSFYGKAKSSFQLFDGTGMMLANRTSVASSGMLQSPSLTYIIPANDVIRNDYSCNVILSSDSSLATAYNKTVKKNVLFSVRHTTIVPESMSDCQKDGFCKLKMKMLCSADGSSNPAHYWTVYFNGNVSNSSELYYYTSNIGLQTIQCTAYNVIGGKTCYDSYNFTTNVTEKEYRPTPPTASPSTADESKVPLIVGLVVGLGGGLIIILVIVIVVLWKRKKRRTHCCTLDGMKSDNGAQQMEVSNGAGKPGNGKITSGGPMPDVMPTQQKTRGSDETVLVENDIYARDSKAAPGHTNHIHTFDGGYSSLDDLDKK